MSKTPEQYRVEDQALRDQRILEARLMGYEVIESDDFNLLLDIDRNELGNEFWALVGMVCDRFGGPGVVDQWKSKSGNLHVIVRVGSPLPAEARIALQAALGSDPWKEMMSLSSFRLGVTNPILLFRPPPKLLPKPS